MATSNFPFSRHKYQDGRCRIPSSFHRSRREASNPPHYPPPVPLPFRSTAAILNAILDLRSRGSRENSSKICVTFLYSLPTEYYSHRFTFTVVTSRAFCCLDRLRAINLSTFVSSSNSNSIAVSQTSKLTPRTLAPSQANANRAECVNSALKEGYPLPVAGGGEKKQNKTLRRSRF